MKFKDHEETANAGDAYYVVPGHTGAVFDAGTEVVEFSPKDKLKKTMEVIMRNFEAMQKKKEFESAARALSVQILRNRRLFFEVLHL